MVGYWQGFPLLETTAITMLGGILGVLFSVPLRRALVVDSDLPYPEGRAAAEVLQVGAASAEGAEENKAGLSALMWNRSEEHTSELQSLMRISYAVFCLKKKKNEHKKRNTV